MERILSETAIAALSAVDPEAASQARWNRARSPAARRLDGYKRKAANLIETILKHHQPSDYRDRLIADGGNWRRQRYPRIHHGGKWGDKPDATGDLPFYVDAFDSDLGLRELGRADEVAKRDGGRIEESGWYVDSFQSETVAGHVLQLPARNGRPRYIVGLAWSDCDGVTLYPFVSSDEPLDAAHQANRLAERMAEHQRDHDSAWNAGRRFAEMGEFIAATRKCALALLAEMKAERRGEVTARPVICATLRERVDGYLEDIRLARAKRAALKNGDSDSFSWGVFHPDAFNDGADEEIFARA